MKKTILLFLVATAMSGLSAQNLAGNPGFEDDPATFTVVESSTNVLRRTNNSFFDVVTQTANPTSDAAAITPGMWIKKAMNSGYIKFKLTTSEMYSGTTALNMFINKNLNTPTNMTLWYNAVASQKLPNALDNTKKYRVSVWAKKDATADNVCSSVTLYITDNVKRTLLSRTIDLVGDGTTWTKYEYVFDIPAHIVDNATADFTVAYAGVGIKTIQDGVTSYSGLIIDDFSVSEESISTGISSLPSASDMIRVADGKLVSDVNADISIFSANGSKIMQQNILNGESLSLAKGMYIIRLTTRSGSYSTKVVL